MNYLLFVFFNETISDVEIAIKEMAHELKDNPLTSGSVNYLSGGGLHVVFNFSCEMNINDMNEYVKLIEFGLFPFEFILMPKPNEIKSSLPKRKFNAFLSGEPIENNIKNDIEMEPFLDKDVDLIKMFDKVFNEFNEEMSYRESLNKESDLTIDEILDKIKLKGIKSLTVIEKNKLDNFSKTI
jgi:hypothetical protein